VKDKTRHSSNFLLTKITCFIFFVSFEFKFV
jgi:hypothetical protein